MVILWVNTSFARVPWWAAPLNNSSGVRYHTTALKLD